MIIRGGSGPILRASSSLDSPFGIGPDVGPYINIKRPQSPYSSNSDITNFFATTYGYSTNKSPTNTEIGKQLTKGQSLSSTGLIGTRTGTGVEMEKMNFADEIKNIQEKILKELKTNEVVNTGSIGTGTNRPLQVEPGAKSTLNNLTIMNECNSYKNVLENCMENQRLRSSNNNNNTNITNNNNNNGSNNNWRNTLNLASTSFARSQMAPSNNINQFGKFKSYEFESLNPVRFGDDKYRLTRPMSSILFHENCRNNRNQHHLQQQQQRLGLRDLTNNGPNGSFYGNNYLVNIAFFQ